MLLKMHFTRIQTQHRTGDSLYREYNKYAIIEAIKKNKPFRVLKYLIQEKNCPLDFSFPCFLNEEHDYEEISIVALAAKHGRRSFIHWLTTYHKIVPEQLKDAFIQAVLYKKHETMKWFIEKKICTWSDLITIIDEELDINSMDQRNLYLIYFNQYTAELLHANNLETALKKLTDPFNPPISSTRNTHSSSPFFANKLQRFEQQKNEFKKLYIPFLNKVLELTLAEEDIYKKLLASYEKVDFAAASQFHITLSLRKMKFKEVANYCFDIIYQKKSGEELARITLTELLLANQFELDETNSPLNHFMIKKNEWKRAIEAYFLMKDCKGDTANQIKQRLHQLLSGNPFLPILPVSLETWLPEVRYFYILYSSYKESANDANLQKVIQLELSSTEMKGESQKEPPISKDKRRQTRLDYYFLPPHKKPKNNEILASPSSIPSKTV